MNAAAGVSHTAAVILAIGLASLGLHDTARAQDAPAASLTVADLVAPVALYPDQLLGQVLTVSSTPQEVLDLGAWLIDNDSLPGSKAEAAKAAGFSASAQYLAMFPQVVDNMGQQIEWTTQLGDAYTDDASAVMAAIQAKRAEAEQVGNLKTSEQMTVTDKKADDGSTYIEITPTDPKVIYVPAYNPVTVYVTAPPATTTVVQQQPTASGGSGAGIGLLSFGIGMAVGSSINNSYYPYPSWGYGGMYYGGRPYYPPPYRPPYYAGYRPAYGYNPPPNYRWNKVNRETNITVNNNGYYNKVNRNNSNRSANSNRPGQIAGGSNRSGGNKDRPGAGNDRPGNNRPGGSVSKTNARPSGGGGGGDRGYGGGGGGGGGRPAAAPSRPSPSPAASRPSPAASRPAPKPQGGGAFGGASGASSGNSARAASSRGRASAGASRGGGGGGRSGGGGGRKR